MNVSSDNIKVLSEIKYVSCPVNSKTIIVPPSNVKKYLGSIENHIVFKIGTIQTGGNVNVINTEHDETTGYDWCLINYNGCYYYTPKEYINLKYFTEPNNTAINLDTINSHSDTFAGVSSPVMLKASKETSTTSNNSTTSRYKKLKDYNETGEGYALAYCKDTDYLRMFEPSGSFAVDSTFAAFTYPSMDDKICPMEIFFERLRKNNLFPVQSLWEDTATGLKFFGTSYFANDNDEIYYVPKSHFNLKYQGAALNRYYSMCYKKYVSLRVIMTDYEIAEAFAKGDIFYATFEAEHDGEQYGHFTINGNVYAAKPDHTYMSPFAHSANAFNTEYVGVIRNTYANALCKTINTAMLSRNEWGGGKKRIRYEDFNWFLKTNITGGTLNSFKQEYLQWLPLQTALKFSKIETDELITFNKVPYDGHDYWLCAYPDGKNRYFWYFVEDNEEVDWVKLEYDYNDSSDLPTYKLKVDNVVVKDPSVNTSESKGKDPNGGYATKITDPKYIEDQSKETPIYDEEFYEMTLNPGDTNWDVPGIMKNAPDVDVEYDGYRHLHEALSYELQEENHHVYIEDDRHIKSINRFRLMTRDLGLSTKSFIFMTRPDLNLYKEIQKDDNPAHDTIDPYSMNPDLIRLPTFKYIARLRNACRTIMPSLEYWGTNSVKTPWLSIITNQAMSYAPLEREIDRVEVGETFHGSKVVYAEPTFRHKIAGIAPIQFMERRDLSLYYTLKMWIEYIQMVSIGRCSPRRIHIWNHELDYAVSLYYITTDETMENILYWEKLTGVIPLTVPDNFFEWSKGNNDRQMEYTINFAYSFRTVQDEMHLAEINNLYNKYRYVENANATDRSEVIYKDYNYSYDPLFNHIMTKVAGSFGTLEAGVYDSSDEAIAKFAADQGTMEQFYYGNKPRGANANMQTHPHGYQVYAQNESGQKIVVDNLFLPNYIPSIGMHGVPYVKGPFITREPDRTTDGENTGTPMDNGIYKLRWV